MTNPFSSLELEPVENKNVKVVTVGFIDESGRYRIGPPTRPNIKHDNGHLDLYKPRDPTASDRIQFAKWTAMLEGSEALCNAQTGKWVPGCTDDLTDANAAYRHFLFGDGKDRQINYERFLQNDSSGKVLIEFDGRLSAPCIDYRQRSQAVLCYELCIYSWSWWHCSLPSNCQLAKGTWSSFFMGECRYFSLSN